MGRVSIVATTGRAVRRSQLRPIDVVLALGIAVVQVGGAALAGHGQNEPLSAFGALLLAAGALALLARRRAPRTVLSIALVATTAYELLDEPNGPVFFALIVALFTTMMAGRRGFAWVVLVVGYGLIMWLPSIVTDDETPELPEAMAIVAWLLVLGTGAEIARVRRERAIERARAAEQEARRRAGEQRLRIARELHDTLAHNISLINVQAGAALHLLDERPDQARPALTAIKQATETLCRAALRARHPARCRRRRGAADPGARAGAARRAARRRARRRPDGRNPRRGRAPAAAGRVELAAFRIVQEALTNVSRHAGPARATISLRYGADELASRSTMTARARTGGTRTSAPAAATGSRACASARARSEARSTPARGRRRRLPRARAAAAGGRAVVIRVLLADDQALVRGGFRSLLDAQDDIEVVGEASDGEEALKLARKRAPDVVLMDIRMPGVDGLAATRAIAGDERLAGVRVVILTTFDLDEYVYEALGGGASASWSRTRSRPS